MVAECPAGVLPRTLPKLLLCPRGGSVKELWGETCSHQMQNSETSCEWSALALASLLGKIPREGGEESGRMNNDEEGGWGEKIMSKGGDRGDRLPTSAARATPASQPASQPEQPWALTRARCAGRMLRACSTYVFAFPELPRVNNLEHKTCHPFAAIRKC